MGILLSGTAYIAVDQQGENTILVSPGSNMRFSPADATEAMQGIAQQAALVLTQAEIPTETIDVIAVEAHKSEIRFVLNLAPFARVSHSTLRNADPLIVNSVEAEDTLDYLYGGERHLIKDVIAARHFAGVLSRVAKSVIITLGSDGCMVGTGGATLHIPAVQVDSVVDTTGAGDAFVGAVAASLVNGDDLEAAATQANVASANIIERRGATHIVADNASPRPVPNTLTGINP